MKQSPAAANNLSSFTTGIISLLAILVCMILLQFMFQPFGGVATLTSARPEFGHVMIRRDMAAAPPEDPLSIIPPKAGLLVSLIGNGTLLTPASAIIPSVHANSFIAIKGNWELFNFNEDATMPAHTIVTGFSTAEPVMAIPAEPAVLIKDTMINE